MGVLLYEMLAFKEPFRGRTIGETFDRIINEDPIPPSERVPERDIPTAVEAIALKAMSKNPEDRFASAMDFIQVIREAQHDLPDAIQQT